MSRSTFVSTSLSTGLALVALVAAPLSAQRVVELPAEDRPLAPTLLEEVYRVGSFDGDDWETFGEVQGVTFDADGNMYVFDRQSSRIVMVDPSGAFVREVGRAGEGPGELRSPGTFTVLRDGRVVVADMGHRAYTVYGPDGSYERSVSMGQPDELRIGEMHPSADGSGVISGGGNVMLMSTRVGPGGEPEGPTTRPIEHWDLTGERVGVRTLVDAWQPPRPDEPEALEGGGMSFRMQIAGPRTFEPGLYVGVLGDGGVAYADSSTWAIKVTGADGAVRQVLRRPFQPRPVTEEVEEAEKARRLAELEEGEGPRVQVTMRGPGGEARSLPQGAIKEMMRGRIEQMQFYPELPVIMEMQGGWDGTLWVQRRGEEPAEPGPLDVVTPDGRYMGTFAPDALAMPDAFGPDGLVAFIETDEFDVPTVVVRRLPPILR